MFGYVTVNKPEIKFKDFDVYRSFYCGLCRELRERYGIPGQISLTYDMTFVVLLLSALYEPPTKKGTSRCVVHPLKPQPVRKNTVTEYCADMNVILTYYKCMDDWQDEHKPLRYAYAGILKNCGNMHMSAYPEKIQRIRNALEELSSLEKQGETDVDRVAGCSGRAGDHRHHRNQPQDHGKNTPVDIFSLWIIGCKKHAKQMDQQKQKWNSKNCHRLAAPAVGQIVLIKMCCDLLRQTVPQQDPCQ